MSWHTPKQGYSKQGLAVVVAESETFEQPLSGKGRSISVLFQQPSNSRTTRYSVFRSLNRLVPPIFYHRFQLKFFMLNAKFKFGEYAIYTTSKLICSPNHVRRTVRLTFKLFFFANQFYLSIMMSESKF
jgi:hypothetical protein